MKSVLRFRPVWVLSLGVSLAGASCKDDGGGDGSGGRGEVGGGAGQTNGKGGDGNGSGRAGSSSGSGGASASAGEAGEPGSAGEADSGGGAGLREPAGGEGGSSDGGAGEGGASGGAGGGAGAPDPTTSLGGGTAHGSGVFRVTSDAANEHIVGLVRLGNDYAVVYNKNYIADPAFVSFDYLPFARVHDAGGKPRGGEFPLATREVAEDVFVATAACAHPDGGFLVGLKRGTLEDHPTQPSVQIAEYHTTLLRHFDAEGEIVTEWTVPGADAVSCLPDGRWAVAWVTGSGTNKDTVNAQVEGAGAFVVDTATSNETNQGFGQSASPAIAPSGDGIAAAWRTRTADGETLQGDDVFVGSFTSEGEVVVPERKLNVTESLSSAGSISLGRLADGGFVVTWAFLTQGYTRVLDADLVPAGSEFYVTAASSTSSQLFGVSAVPGGYALSASLIGGDARGVALLPFDASGTLASPLWLESERQIFNYRARSIVSLGENRIATAFVFTEGDPNDLASQWDVATEVVSMP